MEFSLEEFNRLIEEEHKEYKLKLSIESKILETEALLESLNDQLNALVKPMAMYKSNNYIKDYYDAVRRKLNGEA